MLSLGEVDLLTLGVITILLLCASLSLTGSAFTWESRLTDAWGNIYSVALRQSNSNRKQLRFRLNHSLVLGFVHLKFMDQVKSLVIYLLTLGDESIHPHAQVLI